MSDSDLTKISLIKVSTGETVKLNPYDIGHQIAFISYLNGDKPWREADKERMRKILGVIRHWLDANYSGIKYVFHDALCTGGAPRGMVSPPVHFALDNCSIVILLQNDREGNKCNPWISGWVTDEMWRAKRKIAIEMDKKMERIISVNPV